MTYYGPAAANPNRGEPQAMRPHEYEKFHRKQELDWGIEPVAERAEANGTTLMVKDPINGEVHPHVRPELVQRAVGEFITNRALELAA